MSSFGLNTLYFVYNKQKNVNKNIFLNILYNLSWCLKKGWLGRDLINISIYCLTIRPQNVQVYHKQNNV